MVASEKTLSLQDVLESPYRENPYPLYHRLREEDPVHWEPALSRWVVTRYADVMAVLRDGRFSSARGDYRREALPAAARGRLDSVGLAYAHHILFLDQPEHTRVRRLMSKAFTPRMVAAMRSRIVALVDELLAEPRRSGQMDLRAAVAFPLPVTVIAALLGVPAADQAQFALWSHGFETLLDGVPLTDDQLVDAFEQVAAMMEYLRSATARHRLQPADDLLQALIAAQDEGVVLTEDEALMNAVALLAAGHITTTNLLCNGLLALLRHPAQMQRLRQEPALLPYAVEELLRYDGPVQAMGRLAREDLEVGERQIAAGARVMVVMGAANHDPARFPDPDVLDITRESGQHLTFGHGPHYCLGAPLARLEAEIAFDALLRLEDLRLDSDEPVWKQTTVFRGVEALPIAFRPQP